ncbi:hypothetical protein SDC9_129559 [bioreactor metagenome]|uniref:Uncharacterized protein n=1 Tax=bioreactor metagenome TaxID=1076179 RepID=A0A645D061_9ZZZZ
MFLYFGIIDVFFARSQIRLVDGMTQDAQVAGKIVLQVGEFILGDDG